MGRVHEYIQVNGRKCWTLFDTGALNTYVTKEVAQILTKSKLKKPFSSALGGSSKVSKELAILEAKVQGHSVATHAMVLNEIGADEEGKPIEVLFGALAMQQGGIRPIPDQKKVGHVALPESLREILKECLPCLIKQPSKTPRPRRVGTKPNKSRVTRRCTASSSTTTT